MADQEEGGTKIQRRPVQQIPQQMPPQIPQQMPQQMPQQTPQQMPQQVQQMKHQFVNNSVPSSIKNGTFKGFSFSNPVGKSTLLVIIIFILLNSRIAWRAISRIPMMGSIEPSILALIVNSLIAGIAFYILSKKFNS
jgi:membrane glycosyltransferase